MRSLQHPAHGIGAVRIFPLVGLALALLGGSCGEDPPYLVINITGADKSVRAVRITATVSGQTATEEFPGTATQVGMYLPKGAAGPVALDAQGLHVSGCSAAAGHAEGTVASAGRSEVTLPLVVKSPALCDVTITQVHPAGMPGVVTNVNPPVQCMEDSCRVSLPLGMTLRLEAKAAGRAYLAGWSEGCGTGLTCDLQIQAPREITVRFAPRTCHQSGWCHEFPLPNANSYLGIWVSSDKEAWAAGVAGTVMRWDGQVWASQPWPGKLLVYSMWGSSASDIWAVGSNGAMHWDGKSWVSFEGKLAGTNLAVWGSAANDIWAVGSSINHWDGNAWSVATMPPNALYGVWGSGPNDVWAAGISGLLMHYTGGKWVTVPSGVTASFLGVFGTSASDVWAVGSSSTALHYDGSRWTAGTMPGAVENYFGLFGFQSNDLFAISDRGTVTRWDGKAWLRFTEFPNASFYRLHGSAAGNIWAVGTAGSLARYDGKTWTGYPAGQKLPSRSPTAVWASSPTDVWTAGSAGGILHFDGTTWTEMVPTTGLLRAVWGSGPTDVWFAGVNTLLRWDGATMNDLSAKVPALGYTAIGGSSANNVWLVSDSGQALRWNGTSFAQFTAAMTRLSGVWTNGPTLAWAVGDTGVTVRWNGSAWVAFGTGTMNNLYAVFGVSATDVWTVGDGGVVMRSTGGNFVSAASPRSDTMRALWGSSAGDVWAVGSSASIWHFDGASWTALEGPSIIAPSSLTGVWGTGARDVWAVGANTVLRYRP